MDPNCAVITLLLLIQMVVVLVMLNPAYDVRKIINYINAKTKTHKYSVLLAAALYFAVVLYVGIYTPLLSIIDQLLTDEQDQYEKVLLLLNIEKNCLMTGFSLFLVVVFYGIKSLVAYSASLMELSDRQLSLSKPMLNPYLRKTMNVKRSYSYETILFAKDFKEQLTSILKHPSIAFSNHRFKLPHIPGVHVAS